MNNFPQQGDVIKITAEPHAGHEWGGHDPKKGNIERHMLVVSATPYNRVTGFIVGMPITTSEIYAKDEHYKPILIMGNKQTGVKGYVCLYQVLNYDYIFYKLDLKKNILKYHSSILNPIYNHTLNNHH